MISAGGVINSDSFCFTKEKIMANKNFSDYNNLTTLFTNLGEKKTAVENNIAPVESDASSSSKAYAVNSRLILGDKLYKVIAAIDIGDALIVGTNIELSSNLVTLIGQGGGGGETYYAGPGINISDDNVISSKAVEFAGTQAEWDALSASQKSVFDYINITDDTSEETYQPGHSISDGTSEKTQREVLEFEGFTVTDDSVNGKTKVAEVPYTAGDGVEITEKEISVSDEISRTWTGTTAEWNAIVDKSVYDGWIINITDDQASGIGVVVDAVQDGNMNAVTSNAVATALADKQDKTDNNLTTTAKTVVGGINELKNDLIKKVEFDNFSKSVVQWSGTDDTFNWLFKFESINTWFALKISYSGLEYVVSEDGGQTWRTLWAK
jgi:hypothetical protein